MLVVPPPELCTDNGAMIAWAGAERLALGLTDTLDVAPRARWPLDEVRAAQPRTAESPASRTGLPTIAPARRLTHKMAFDRIAVVGAGAWGTRARQRHRARRPHACTLAARDRAGADVDRRAAREPAPARRAGSTSASASRR